MIIAKHKKRLLRAAVAAIMAMAVDRAAAVEVCAAQPVGSSVYNQNCGSFGSLSGQTLSGVNCAQNDCFIGSWLDYFYEPATLNQIYYDISWLPSWQPPSWYVPNGNDGAVPEPLAFGAAPGTQVGSAYGVPIYYGAPGPGMGLEQQVGSVIEGLELVVVTSSTSMGFGGQSTTSTDFLVLWGVPNTVSSVSSAQPLTVNSFGTTGSGGVGSQSETGQASGGALPGYRAGGSIFPGQDLTNMAGFSQ